MWGLAVVVSSDRSECLGGGTYANGKGHIVPSLAHPSPER